MNIIIPAAFVAVLGLVFGIVLTIASKKFYVETDPRVDQVRACCAGANCGACGYASCDNFAEAVVNGDAPANGCRPGGNSAAEGIAEIMGVEAALSEPIVARVICQGSVAVAKERYIYNGIPSCRVAAGTAGGPKECRFSCIGLGDCMRRCAFDAIRMENGLCVIDETKCTGCGACVEECPRSVIRLLHKDVTVYVKCRNTDKAREARNVCMTACIACGRCKKACQYDAITVEGGLSHIDPEKCTRCGECGKVCPTNCITLPALSE